MSKSTNHLFLLLLSTLLFSSGVLANKLAKVRDIARSLKLDTKQLHLEAERRLNSRNYLQVEAVRRLHDLALAAENFMRQSTTAYTLRDLRYDFQSLKSAKQRAEQKQAHVPVGQRIFNLAQRIRQQFNRLKTLVTSANQGSGGGSSINLGLVRSKAVQVVSLAQSVHSQAISLLGRRHPVVSGLQVLKSKALAFKQLVNQSSTSPSLALSKYNRTAQAYKNVHLKISKLRVGSGHPAVSKFLSIGNLLNKINSLTGNRGISVPTYL